MLKVPPRFTVELVSLIVPVWSPRLSVPLLDATTAGPANRATLPPPEPWIVPLLLQLVPLTVSVPALSARIVPWLMTATLEGPPIVGVVADRARAAVDRDARPDRERATRQVLLQRVVDAVAQVGEDHAAVGAAQDRVGVAETQDAVVAAGVAQRHGRVVQRQAAADADVGVAGRGQVEHLRLRQHGIALQRDAAAEGAAQLVPIRRAPPVTVTVPPGDRAARQVPRPRRGVQRQAWCRRCSASRSG